MLNTIINSNEKFNENGSHCLIYVVAWDKNYQGRRNRGGTGARAPPIFGAASSCAPPIFSGNFGTDIMGASPIFDTFLRPCHAEHFLLVALLSKLNMNNKVLVN